MLLLWPCLLLLVILSNSSLSLVRLGVDFVLPLSQEQQEQEEPPTKNLSCYRPDFDETLKVSLLGIMISTLAFPFYQIFFYEKYDQNSI